MLSIAQRVASRFYPEIVHEVPEIRLHKIGTYTKVFEEKWRHERDAWAEIDDRIVPIIYLNLSRLKKDEDLEDAIGYELGRIYLTMVTEEHGGTKHAPVHGTTEDAVTELVWISRGGGEAERPGAHRYLDQTAGSKVVGFPGQLEMPFPRGMWPRFAAEAKNAAQDALRKFSGTLDAVEYWEGRMAAYALPSLPPWRRWFGWPVGQEWSLTSIILVSLCLDFIGDVVSVKAGHPFLALPNRRYWVADLSAILQDLGQLIVPGVLEGIVQMKRHRLMARYFEDGRWGSHRPLPSSVLTGYRDGRARVEGQPLPSGA